MDEKDINNILDDTKPQENKILIEKSNSLNYLSDNWIDEWEHHHGDIS
jgi:hypothetical protein